MGYSPRGHKESDTTEQHFHFHMISYAQVNVNRSDVSYF